MGYVGQACPTFALAIKQHDIRPVPTCDKCLPQPGRHIREYVRQACPTFAQVAKQRDSRPAW